MPKHEFVNPYYYEQLNNEDLKEIQEYISKLSDSDYKHNEFDYYDGHEDKKYDVYRSCEIHYPKTSEFALFDMFNSMLSNQEPESENLLYKIGKKIFRSINEKYYHYDLDDVFEFQLIKYHVGGEYNWHVDYGVSPQTDVVRKLSITMQLSDPSSYEGGELQLVDYGNHLVMMEKYLGRVLVFDAKVPHKVWPVTWGERLVLVGWVSGPQLR